MFGTKLTVSKRIMCRRRDRYCSPWTCGSESDIYPFSLLVIGSLHIFDYCWHRLTPFVCLRSFHCFQSAPLLPVFVCGPLRILLTSVYDAPFVILIEIPFTCRELHGTNMSRSWGSPESRVSGPNRGKHSFCYYNFLFVSHASNSAFSFYLFR